MRYNDLPTSGEALRARIYECGYNMSTFAKAVDVTPSAVHKWVRDGYPAGRHLARVLELLHPELRPPDDNERLEALENEVMKLRADVLDIAELLRRLVDRQLGVDESGPAIQDGQGRRRSRP